MKKCFCFRFHFEVNILTRFGIFCSFIYIISILLIRLKSLFCFITLMFKSNCMQKGLKNGQRPVEVCNTLVSVIRPSGRPVVRKQYLVLLSPPKLNTVETYLWFHVVGPMTLLCMCNFGPVRTPWVPQGDFIKQLKNSKYVSQRINYSLNI